MSLRRSARARVPAGDPDVLAGVGGDKRKRKRSTMTPETSQSPAKAGSPLSESGQLYEGAASSSSPTIGRPSSTRKIVVKSARKSLNESSQNGLADLKTEDIAETEEELQELYLEEEDRSRLETVLKVYCSDLLTQKAASSRKPGQSVTLQQILSQRPCSIRTIRNHILALRAPLITASALRSHLSSSHISPPTEEIQVDRKKLSSMTMVLAVIDEIASRQILSANDVEMTENGKTRKREDDFALHMRLPSGDYFTNAVRLPMEKAFLMDTGYSKLLSVATQPVSLDTRPPPTLKDRLPKVKLAAVSDSTEEEPAKPVSHLYYSPWSSFAPSYDSFDGSLSMEASCALWRTRKADRQVVEAMAEEPRSTRQELKEVLEELPDIDADAVLEAYDELRGPPSLKRNALLLGKLDELQSQRWKRTFAKRTLTQTALLEEPNTEERKVAGEILDTLSQLLSQHSGPLTQILPSKEVLHAAAGSACIDPALTDGKGEPGYWGSLNENFYGPSATRRVTGARSAPVRPPAAIRDNETIRMEPANDEKVSAAMAQMAVMGKGKGMLERFASGRQYALEDHPHDRKFVVAGSTMPSQQQALHPQSQQQLSHQSKSLPHHQSSPQSSRPPMPPSRPSQRQFMSPPMSSTPPAARPFHTQMRPSPAPSPYQQQQQKMAYFRPPGGGQPPRTWSQSPQNATGFYPARPFTGDHRFVSGSPS